MNINLHIERLVLEGVNIAPDERHLLQASVITELTRMLNNGGLDHHYVEGVAFPRLSTKNIELTDNKPNQLGKKIAQSVFGGINHE